MGAWGYGIYENDSAVDIAEGFQDYLEEGKSVETALRRICEDYSDCKSEEYVLALVELQIRYGIIVDLPLFDEAKKMCTDEEAMQDWDEPEKRREELNKLLKKIQKFTPSIKKESSVYMLPIHPYAHRRNQELAQVIGVHMFKPMEHLKARMCYKVRFHSDGFTDHVTFTDVENGHYKLITQEECDEFLLKEITNDNL